MGEPLHRGGKSPGIGHGGQTAEAEDCGARHDGGPDRQERGWQPRPAVAPADWTRPAGLAMERGELAAEGGERLGFTV
jgi:hypothetical protein